MEVLTIIMSICLGYLMYFDKMLIEAAALSCSNGEYFDVVTNACSPCTDICLNARLQNTQDICDQLCGESSHDKVKPNTILDTNGGPMSKGSIAGITVPTALIVILVVIFVVYFREHIQRRLRPFLPNYAAPLNLPPLNQPNQEVGRHQDGHVDKPEPFQEEKDSNEQETLLKIILETDSSQEEANEEPGENQTNHNQPEQEPLCSGPVVTSNAH